jgi:hypothetical protein
MADQFGICEPDATTQEEFERCSKDVSRRVCKNDPVKSLSLKFVTIAYFVRPHLQYPAVSTCEEVVAGFRVDPALTDEEIGSTILVNGERVAFAPYCTRQLAKWLVVYGNTEDGFGARTDADEELAFIRFVSVLHGYLRQLIGPELAAHATFSRIRPRGPHDDPGISYYIDHGIFLTW